MNDEDERELRYDVHGDGSGTRCVSRASLLVFLNGHDTRAFEGGHTEFVPEAALQAHAQLPHSAAALRLRPVTGAGVFFMHGEHPLSPLHAGTEVTAGEKVILRTDIIYGPAVAE